MSTELIEQESNTACLILIPHKMMVLRPAQWHPQSKNSSKPNSYPQDSNETLGSATSRCDWPKYYIGARKTARISLIFENRSNPRLYRALWYYHYPGPQKLNLRKKLQASTLLLLWNSRDLATKSMKKKVNCLESNSLVEELRFLKDKKLKLSTGMDLNAEKSLLGSEAQKGCVLHRKEGHDSGKSEIRLSLQWVVFLFFHVFLVSFLCWNCISIVDDRRL